MQPWESSNNIRADIEAKASLAKASLAKAWATLLLIDLTKLSFSLVEGLLLLLSGETTLYNQPSFLF